MSIVDFFKNRKANKIDKKLDVEDELSIIPMEIMGSETKENTAQKYVLSDIHFYKGEHIIDGGIQVLPFIYNKDNSRIKNVIDGTIYNVPERLSGYQVIDRRTEIAQGVIGSKTDLVKVEKINIENPNNIMRSGKLRDLAGENLDRIRVDFSLKLVGKRDISVIVQDLEESFNKDLNQENARKAVREKFDQISQETREF